VDNFARPRKGPWSGGGYADGGVKRVRAIVPASAENVKRAGRLLREGGLVSFPTETVYGLGACGTNEQAVGRIFEAKGRPFTDPLILHVASLTDVRSLVVMTSRLAVVVEVLARRFWPGPLTLVLPASDAVPAVVRAGGPTVAVRIPGHPVALSIIEEAGVPIAAPSANRFGHVSPTRAEHVAADLDAEGLLIVDGGSCPVGIESTIVKCEEGRLTLLRRGYVTLHEICEALGGIIAPECITAPRRSDSETDAQEAPGGLLTHYAPDVPAFLVGPLLWDEEVLLNRAVETHGHSSSTVVVDVGGRLAHIAPRALAYRDLATRRDGPGDRSALRYAFDALRWAEAVPGAKRILLPDLGGESSELLQALADRFFRSASGRTIG
jgi:L-threonylcarbamoyladenylate synthase